MDDDYYMDRDDDYYFQLPPSIEILLTINIFLSMIIYYNGNHIYSYLLLFLSGFLSIYFHRFTNFSFRFRREKGVMNSISAFLYFVQAVLSLTLLFATLHLYFFILSAIIFERMRIYDPVK